jgi:SAM-dependent methyltransferase
MKQEIGPLGPIGPITVMGDLNHYVIRGGIRGRERLKVIARVLHDSTSALFDRVGVGSGSYCLDIGCGSGDITFELARRVGPDGRVVGADIDQTKLQLADDESKTLNLTNVEFKALDIRERPSEPSFDLVYARFLLTHLSDPSSAVDCFHHYLKPGGTLIVEDIDFSGYFVHPPCSAFDRYTELYCAAVRKRGGDPNIGPRLPSLLRRGGFVDVGVSVVQPVALEGATKLITPLTMENIGDAAVADGLTTKEEVDEIVKALYDYAADPTTLVAVPRIVQSWGRSERVK